MINLDCCHRFVYDEHQMIFLGSNNVMQELTLYLKFNITGPAKFEELYAN